MFTDIQFYK